MAPTIRNTAFGNASGVTTISTSTINTNTGSTFIICNPSSSANTPTDNFGNTYTLVAQSPLTPNSFRVNVYICVNGIGGTGHYATSTYSSSGARYVGFYEIAPSTLDQFNSSEQTTPPFTITTSTLSNSSELVLIFGVQDYTSTTYTLTPPTGYSTQLSVLTSGGTYDAYLFTSNTVSSTTAINTSWTSSSTTRGGASVIVTLANTNQYDVFVATAIMLLFPNQTSTSNFANIWWRKS